MPSGKIHSIANIAVAVSGSTTMFLLQMGTEGIAGVAIGAMTGILCGPDQDVDGGNISDYIIRRYIGVALEMAWDCAWMPYRKICRHRGILSHAPIISTVLRVLYLSALYFIVATPLKLVINIVHIDWPLLWWWAFVGLVLADASHYGLDKLDEAMGGRL